MNSMISIWLNWIQNDRRKRMKTLSIITIKFDTCVRYELLEEMPISFNIFVSFN